MGRKSKWESHILPNMELIKCYCRDGLTEAQICAKIDVAVSTFESYKSKKKELVELLKEGKEQIDYEVENKLLQRAMGYKYVEKTVEKNADGEVVKEKEITKEVVPDTTAQIFWLKNRQHEKWRDRKNIEFDNGVPVVIKDEKARKERIKELKKKKGE